MKRWTLLFLLFGVCNFLWAQGSNVTLMGTWDGASLDYSDIWGYVDPSGGEYAIIGSLTKIHVVDVTVPSAPALVGELTPGNSSIWRDFKTYGNYAYGVADQGTEGLVVIDLSNVPSSISLAGQYSIDFKRAHNVFIDTQNGRLYVIGSSGGIHPANNGLIVYDLVANPANPVRLSSTPLAGGYVHDAFIKNHIAYCSHGTNGLYVYNMSNASSPVLLGSLTSYPEQGYNHSGWLSEDGNSYVFADETHGKKMKIANVSDLSNITVGPNNVFRQCLLAPGNNGCIPHNPFILGNFVYISYYHDGLQVFDISNPSNVTSVGYYDTYPGNTNYSGYEGAWGCYPYLPSGVVLISDISTGLYVLDFNMPLPVELVSFRGEYNAGTVTLNWSTMSEPAQRLFHGRTQALTVSILKISVWWMGMAIPAIRTITRPSTGTLSPASTITGCGKSISMVLLKRGKLFA
ncbi:MAG: choice-of-anchor B family protein [Lewinellaceae bacterium]|nr:choice-of-anchor B family protein [Lewinellaceae bacterium]